MFDYASEKEKKYEEIWSIWQLAGRPDGGDSAKRE